MIRSIPTKAVLALFFLVSLAGCLSQPGLQLAEPIARIGQVEIYDDRARAFIDSNTAVDVRANGFKWTEGPVWIESGQYLLFSDIPQNRIFKYDVSGNKTSEYLKNSGWSSATPERKGLGSNGLLLNRQQQLVLMQWGERAVSVLQSPLEQPEHKISVLANTYQGKKLNHPNDAVLHSNGDIYFTDPTHGMTAKLARKKEQGYSRVYRLSENGELAAVVDELSYPNGIGLSPDERTLYVSVSDKQKPAWYAYDLDDRGNASNGRIFYETTRLLGKQGHQGYPDGMAVHSTGVIFATGPGGVWLFAPDGTVLAKVFTGEFTSNAELSDDESTLFITADDYLLSLSLKRQTVYTKIE